MPGWVRGHSALSYPAAPVRPLGRRLTQKSLTASGRPGSPGRPVESREMTTDAQTAASAAFPPERRWQRYRWTLFVSSGVLLGVYQGLNHAIATSNEYPKWQPFVW